MFSRTVLDGYVNTQSMCPLPFVVFIQRCLWTWFWISIGTSVTVFSSKTSKLCSHVKFVSTRVVAKRTSDRWCSRDAQTVGQTVMKLLDTVLVVSKVFKFIHTKGPQRTQTFKAIYLIGRRKMCNVSFFIQYNRKQQCKVLVFWTSNHNC